MRLQAVNESPVKTFDEFTQLAEDVGQVDLLFSAVVASDEQRQRGLPLHVNDDAKTTDHQAQKERTILTPGW